MKNYEQLSLKQQRLIMIAFITVFAVLMVIISAYVGKPLIEYAREPEKFKQWIDSYGFIGKVLYVLIVSMQVIVAIIPGEPFEIAGGYCFGVLWGTLLCLAGILLGSALIFMFVHKFGRYFVEIFIKKETIEKLDFLQDPTKLNTLTFIIFAIPGTPKDLLTYTVGLTDMKLPTWILISFFARIPSVITSVYAGQSLMKQDYLRTVIVFAVTMLISAAGIYIYNRHTQTKK